MSAKLVSGQPRPGADSRSRWSSAPRPALFPRPPGSSRPD